MRILNNKELAIHLSSLIEEKGLSQGQIAQRAGMREATLSDFKNARSDIRVSTLFKLINELGIELHLNSKQETPTNEKWDEQW